MLRLKTFLFMMCLIPGAFILGRAPVVDSAAKKSVDELPPVKVDQPLSYRFTTSTVGGFAGVIDETKFLRLTGILTLAPVEKDGKKSGIVTIKLETLQLTGLRNGAIFADKDLAKERAAFERMEFAIVDGKLGTAIENYGKAGPMVQPLLRAIAYEPVPANTPADYGVLVRRDGYWELARSFREDNVQWQMNTRIGAGQTVVRDASVSAMTVIDREGANIVVTTICSLERINPSTTMRKDAFNTTRPVAPR